MASTTRGPRFSPAPPASVLTDPKAFICTGPPRHLAPRRLHRGHWPDCVRQTRRLIGWRRVGGDLRSLARSEPGGLTVGWRGSAPRGAGSPTTTSPTCAQTYACKEDVQKTSGRRRFPHDFSPLPGASQHHGNRTPATGGIMSPDTNRVSRPRTTGHSATGASTRLRNAGNTRLCD